jgi:hypothetical protein
MTPERTKRTCANCACSALGGASAGGKTIECRAHPPKGNQIGNRYPIVQATDWCLEHRTKSEDPRGRWITHSANLSIVDTP